MLPAARPLPVTADFWQFKFVNGRPRFSCGPAAASCPRRLRGQVRHLAAGSGPTPIQVLPQHGRGNSRALSGPCNGNNFTGGFTAEAGQGRAGPARTRASLSGSGPGHHCDWQNLGMTYLKFKFYRRFVTAASNFLSRLSGPCPSGPLPPDHGLRPQAAAALESHWQPDESADSDDSVRRPRLDSELRVRGSDALDVTPDPAILRLSPSRIAERRTSGLAARGSSS